MKNASAKSWSARGASRSWASFQNFHKFPYLPSRWVSLDWCSILRYANDGSVDVQADLRREIMTLKFEVGASSEKSCLWSSVNFSACGDLNCSYWGGLKLRKFVFNNWVFPRLFWGMTGEWWTVEMTGTCLGDFLWKVETQKIVVAIKIRIS